MSTLEILQEIMKGINISMAECLECNAASDATTLVWAKKLITSEFVRGGAITPWEQKQLLGQK